MCRECQGRRTERSSWKRRKRQQLWLRVALGDSLPVRPPCDRGCSHLSRQQDGCWVTSHTSSYPPRPPPPPRISLSVFRHKKRKKEMGGRGRGRKGGREGGEGERAVKKEGGAEREGEREIDCSPSPLLSSFSFPASGLTGLESREGLDLSSHSVLPPGPAGPQGSHACLAPEEGPILSGHDLFSTQGRPMREGQLWPIRCASSSLAEGL